MTLLVHALIGLVLSFIGSIPFGSINVTVIESAILNGFRNALWVIFGASLVEFFQVVIALKFSSLITQYPMTEQILFWMTIPIFIGLAWYYFKQRRSEQTELHGYSKGRGFLKGVIISILNVLAIPFWIFYGTYLDSVDLIDATQNINILVFSFGAFAGMVLLLMVYAKLGEYAKVKFNKITTYIAPGVAWFFVLLAVIQIVRGVITLYR